MDNAAKISEQASAMPSTAKVEMKLEVTVLPVSDVDRAKAFYERLGWRLDADFTTGPDWRVVQLTPPGSPCSILFGTGITNAAPGSVQGSFLVVDDVDAARAELVLRGADVSEVFHFDGGLRVTGTHARLPGRDPEGRSYRSWASFSDPDGNGWLLQEITTRLPGRGFGMDVATLAELLREAEERHGAYEASAAKHPWPLWYGAYVVSRARGATPEAAAGDSARYVEGTRR